MDELLKKCYGGLFKVGDKVRIRRDIKDLAELRRVDIDRYTIIFPNKIQESQKPLYKISYGMIVSAGKTAEVTEIIPSPSGAPLLSTMYRLKISGSYSEWSWKHALLEKVEEENSDNSSEVDGAKWELPLKVGQKVLIRKNLKEDFESFYICGTKFRSAGVVCEMEKFRGCIATITDVSPNEEIVGGYTYSLAVDGKDCGWQWDISMFDGFNAWRDKQEANAKSKTESSPSFPLKVGDIVTVRRDIAKRRNKKTGFIWSTVNGQKIKSPLITSGMVSMAGETGRITSICEESKYNLVYTLSFSDKMYDGLLWGINCLEEFHDYKAYVEGNSGKKKAPRKKSEERGEDYYGDSREIIDDVTGIKTDFFAYDYKGRKRVFPDIDGFITKIDVTIISGDETGLVYFVKDGKANRIAFDASVGTRFISYDDGTYTVEGKDNIKKWLSWSYDKDKAKNVNYAIQHMTDFLGGDK